MRKKIVINFSTFLKFCWQPNTISVENPVTVIYLLIFPYLNLSHLKFSLSLKSLHQTLSFSLSLSQLKTRNLSLLDQYLSLSQISVSLKTVILSLRLVGLCLRSVGALRSVSGFYLKSMGLLYFISLSLSSVVEISMEIGGGTLWRWVYGLWFLLV